MGNQFARYVGYALTNGQTYVIDTTTLMAEEWVFDHDRMEAKQIDLIALHFYQQYSSIPGHVNQETGLGSPVLETD
uniref:Uncharacterized protein n=1 Tax=Romanomermis culicivorax TaxID=13658 RepID=A0A915ITS7_ROMCU